VKFLIYRLLVIVSAAAVLAGCSGGFTLARLDTGAPVANLQLAWFSPAVESDRETLARWRASVGPPVVRATSSAAGALSDRLTLVSWNTALGAGDVAELVRQLRRDRGAAPIVMLLQEVYRRGPAVPRPLTPGGRFAARLGGASSISASSDIESIAAALGMHAYYVPSMRNGGSDSDEDRGNAILSDLPLSDLAAIELPFERQRRVAVAATVAAVTADGTPWRLRIINAHLDNVVPRRAWLGSEYGRGRQARGLVALVDAGTPTVLGGDFNTWFGFSDQVFLETSLAFPQTPTGDRGPTFMGLLRLDHLFYRLPAGWRAAVGRASHRYGSDHLPLIGSVALPSR